MALEPAGISLQAENFTQYIKRLDEIDKKQREIFNVTAQKTGKSYDEVTKAAKSYEQELKRIAAEEKKAEQAAKQLAAAQKTAAATQQQAFISAGTAVIDFAQKIGQTVIEAGKLGAQFQGQQIGLNNLAASFGQSGNEIQAAIQTASKGTISGLDAIQAANQALLFGVAKTPEEFSTLTSSALTLGRTLGLTGTQAIEQFTTALGRQSLLILDNFGISAKQVNAEIERLAQADFGKARSELTEAQKQATFMKAALKIAGEAAATIGDEAGNAQESFDRLTASSENLKVTFGVLVQPLGGGISDALSRAAKTAQQFFAFLGAGFTGVGTIATGVFNNIVNFFKGEATRSISDILDEAGALAIDRFKEIASTIEGVSFPDDKAKDFTDDLQDQEDQINDNAEALKAYQSALQQAESLQLSFARAAEDTAIKQARSLEDLARKQARANEDIARKEADQVSKLQKSQAKEREKLLKDQQKQLDKLETDGAREIQKARQEAGEQRKRDQQKLQRELQQAQERFNLSQLQSERQFKLQESRLIAEGDILGLKELREDNALRVQEEKENFDLSKKEQIASAKDQQKEQAQDLESRIKELKTNLEDQRGELLRSFDEQLRAQQESQAEAKAQLLLGFQEQAAERALALQREEEDRQIALAREEEDRRLSQARQLEDLGRSFAEQEGITAEGTAAVAAELEKVFGIDGVADNIMTGFTTKTENEFTDLFKNLEKIVSEAKIEPAPIDVPVTTTTRQGLGTGGSFGSRIGGVSEFADGGIVPGPIGSPQPAIVHGGETILPTHQRSYQMAAPIIPSQSLDVNMSGGFNISGDGQANEEILQRASQEMTDNFRLAIQRLARRN